MSTTQTTNNQVTTTSFPGRIVSRTGPIYHPPSPPQTRYPTHRHDYHHGPRYRPHHRYSTGYNYYYSPVIVPSDLVFVDTDVVQPIIVQKEQDEQGEHNTNALVVAGVATTIAVAALAVAGGVLLYNSNKNRQ